MAKKWGSKIFLARSARKIAPPLSKPWRRPCANASLPVIADRSCSQLSAFDDVSAEEVLKIVNKAPTKHCYLDPAPTWLVKRLLPLLAETLAKICNASFHEGIFPANLKEAVTTSWQ